jgi:diacylglycerol kinase (ATP)
MERRMNVDVSDAASQAAQGSFAHSAGVRRILAVFNPAAGRNRRARFDQVIVHLRDLGCRVSVIETNAPGHAEQIAREAADEFDVIAAAGGDGTVNEIVNGLAGKSLALGIIPLGTANVLADEIGLSRNVGKVARALAFGPIRPIHVGRVNGRRFVMMAGAGFDANVVNGVSLALKKKLGPLAYVWQAAVQGFREDGAACDVTIDGTSHGTVSVVVCNGRRYGGPFVAAPDASLLDDRFHVVLMKRSGWLNTARYGAALILGRISKLSDVRVIPGRDVVVRGVAGRPIQADGDIVAHLPAQIAVDPEPVALIFPA